MDRDALKKARLGHEDIQRWTPEVIAPTVMRRPVLDAMLADASLIAAQLLAKWRKQAQSSSIVWDEFPVHKFEKIVDLVLKQTKVEMVVEKHVEERAGTIDAEELQQGITSAIDGVLRNYELPDGLRPELMQAVMAELGL